MSIYENFSVTNVFVEKMYILKKTNLYEFLWIENWNFFIEVFKKQRLTILFYFLM
jgi:hypothetical protein